MISGFKKWVRKAKWEVLIDPPIRKLWIQVSWQIEHKEKENKKSPLRFFETIISVWSNYAIRSRIWFPIIMVREEAIGINKESQNILTNLTPNNRSLPHQALPT